MAKGSRKVAVMGPLATPPESKAMAVKILGTYRKVSAKGHGVAGHQQPQDGNAREDTGHGQPHGNGHANGKA